jgi:flagellar basal body-associated protein FliL
MYVDGYLLLVIYLIAVLAAGISVYALWTLKEVEEQFKKKNKPNKPNNAWDYYHNTANQKKHSKDKAKGYFDNL